MATKCANSCLVVLSILSRPDVAGGNVSPRREYKPLLFLHCWTTQGPEMKWNESGFRPPLCTYRLNWARRTSWGWWDDWDDTVLQTQDSKFEPWRSEAEHATSRSRRLPTILTFTRGWGRNIFVSFKPPRPGTEPRTLAWKAAVLTTTLGPPPRGQNQHVDQVTVAALLKYGQRCTWPVCDFGPILWIRAHYTFSPTD